MSSVNLLGSNHVIMAPDGQWWDKWEWEHRLVIERIARKMAIQCAQDPDMMVCLGQPDKVALPGTWGYRYGHVHETRVKPLWEYYSRLAIVAIRELKDGQDSALGIGPSCPAGSDTMAR